MRTTVAASVALLLLLSGAALAQEVAKQEPPGAQSTGLAARRAPQAIEELVITARKREEPRQSVPISISAFTGDELDQAQSDWLVNGNLSYLLPDDRTEISVWVRNWGTGIHRELFRYLRVWSRQILSSRPRHYGVTVRYSF